MCESLGIPLDIIVDQVYSNEMVIDWYDFFITGLEVGWTPERILVRIENAFIDSGFSCENILTRLRTLCKMPV